jgi:hypothetical protein
LLATKNSGLGYPDKAQFRHRNFRENESASKPFFIHEKNEGHETNQPREALIYSVRGELVEPCTE